MNDLFLTCDFVLSLRGTHNACAADKRFLKSKFFNRNWAADEKLKDAFFI